MIKSTSDRLVTAYEACDPTRATAWMSGCSLAQIVNASMKPETYKPAPNYFYFKADNGVE